MHLVQEPLRIDPVVSHQPGQGGAVLVQILLLQGARLVPRQAGLALHVIGHAHLDQAHDLAFHRVEGVVEIEQPDVDVAQIGARPHQARTPH